MKNKIKYSLYIICILSFSECKNENKQKMKIFQDHRISFIILDSAYNSLGHNIFSSKEKSQESLLWLKSMSKMIDTSSNNRYFSNEEKYNSGFDFKTYNNLKALNLKAKFESINIDSNLENSNDLELFQLAYIHSKFDSYFKDSWFYFPEIKFSENFYETYFKNASKLFLHYQYDDDPSNPNHLAVDYKYPGSYEGLPRPHLIDQKFAQELLYMLNQKSSTDSFLVQEHDIFKGMILGVINGKNTIIIKTYL
jgi:hypothetical protein